MPCLVKCPRQEKACGAARGSQEVAGRAHVRCAWQVWGPFLGHAPCLLVLEQGLPVISLNDRC